MLQNRQNRLVSRRNCVPPRGEFSPIEPIVFLFGQTRLVSLISGSLNFEFLIQLIDRCLQPFSFSSSSLDGQRTNIRLIDLLFLNLVGEFLNFLRIGLHRNQNVVETELPERSVEFGASD